MLHERRGHSTLAGASPVVDDAPLALEARHLSKCFLLRHNRSGSIKERALALIDRSRRERTEPFWALRDVNVSIGRGESVALIGRNGSGKSTLLKIVAGIYAPTSGHLFVRQNARIGTMIELGVGFHGELTAFENVYLNAAIYGLSRPAIDELLPRIVEYSGLSNFMDVPIKNFSSGMHMRLGFAIAANLDPDILLLDEVFAVGDVDFQQKCIETMRSFRESGRTILFVSHAAGAVRAVCDRACVIDRGALAFDGSVDAGLREYDRLLHQHGGALPSGAERPAPVAQGAGPWHRAMMGERWEHLGDWAFDFLRREGLKPEHFLLDVGCGSLPVAVRLLPYMDYQHYWGFDINQELFDTGVMVELTGAGVAPERGHFIIDKQFDLSTCPHRFDMALAHSFFHRLNAEQSATCIAAVLKHMRPGGRFYLALSVPREGEASPMVPLVERLASVHGVECAEVAGAGHPRNDQVLVLTKP